MIAMIAMIAMVGLVGPARKVTHDVLLREV